MGRETWSRALGFAWLVAAAALIIGIAIEGPLVR
jgi:hypothetical protein